MIIDFKTSSIEAVARFALIDKNVRQRMYEYTSPLRIQKTHKVNPDYALKLIRIRNMYNRLKKLV